MSCQSNIQKDFAEDEISIIPKPKDLLLSKGSITFNEATKVVLTSGDQKLAANLFVRKFHKASGIEIKIVDNLNSFGILELKPVGIPSDGALLFVDEVVVE